MEWQRWFLTLLVEKWCGATLHQTRHRLHSTSQSDKIPIRRGGEMADTSALGADARKGVEVRVLFSAV